MLDYQFSPGALSLSGDLQVQYLDILKEALDQAFEDPQSLTISFGEVRHVDMAGLQMLLAFLDQRNAPTSLAPLPNIMQRALKLSGLEAPFSSHLE